MKLPDNLTAEPLTKDEAASIKRKYTTSSNTDKLKALWFTPVLDGEGKPVMNGDGKPKMRMYEPGEGIKIGPFDTEAQGMNTIKKIMPEVAAALGWGDAEKKARGRRPVTYSYEPHEVDGGYQIWITRDI